MRFRMRMLLWMLLSAGVLCSQPTALARELHLLFLGDDGHHRPRERFQQAAGPLAARGIRLTYTDRVQDLQPATLEPYDGLLVYANIDRIEPQAASALLDYVAGGKGFIPIHCASYCFRNDPRIVQLTGAQFQRHGTGVFRTEIAAPEHPVMAGFSGFESWDETYVHHLHHEPQRTVLSYRVDQEGREPWTWVRTHGKGRVFYTAWGHDHRTWGHPGFLNLIERGVRWACGDDPAGAGAYPAQPSLPPPHMALPPMGAPQSDLAPFEYVDVGKQIPRYVRGDRWGLQEEPDSQMQQPLPAEESRRHFVAPQGFRVELFAAEPELGGKPICMAWDHRGRLWVAETQDYPNELQQPASGRDRIRICEDTDGDGRADRFTLFAENLSIPTSIAFRGNGVIVQNGTQTLWLRDLDGDDREDERQLLFEGWAMGDTHGGVSNFRYGLDNWIWAMQGYNHSQPTVQGVSQAGFSMGFFRFRPDGSRLEFIRATNNNTWGLGISEEGLVFGSTANRNPSVFMPIPNRYYEQVRGWTRALQLGTIADTHLFRPMTDKVRQVDQFGGYTAAAGHALYTARQYPPAFWNRTAFVNGPTGHLVGLFVLSPQGADFRATSPMNLLASDDEWSAPIMAEVGPDGNVWVLDWYNYIVQHNPTPEGFQTGKGNAYESDLRDKRHGRIYRVAYGDPPPRFSLERATPEACVAALRHDNMLWRLHAQRLLVERGETDVIPLLKALLQERRVDAIGLDVGAMHALRTMEGLGYFDRLDGAARAVLASALGHPSAGVRRNALQVLPRKAAALELLLQRRELLADPEPQVRLAALLALADLPESDEAGAAICQAMSDPLLTQDAWLPDAATSAAARHAQGFLQSLLAVRDPSAPQLEAMRVVAEHHARGGPVAGIQQLVPRLTAAAPILVEAWTQGVTAGWPEGLAMPLSPSAEQQLTHLMADLPLSSRGALVRLARRWGSAAFDRVADGMRQALLELLDDETRSVADRCRAARDLVAFDAQQDDTARQLLERLQASTPPDLARGILAALSAGQAEATGPGLCQRWGALTPELRAHGLQLLVRRVPWTTALLDGIEEGQISWQELALDQQQALAAHPDPRLRRRARRIQEGGGHAPDENRAALLQELLPVARQAGDAARGRELFLKNCSKCHRFGDEGQPVGPDLTGFAVHPKEEILTHIIDPNRSVEGNFRTYTLLMQSGRVLSGMLASESLTALEIVDAEGQRHTVLREEIDELRASQKSLMPEGFETTLTRAQLGDLLEFLVQRSRYVPLNLAKVATISSDRGMFHSREALVERLVFEPWATRQHGEIPFQLLDPQDGRVPNVILLQGPLGAVSRRMPRSVTLPCHAPARRLHFLSGVSGWGYPASRKATVSLTVRLRYEDGTHEDHELLNGVHFADYVRRVEVPGSEFAFALRQQQVRYFAIEPARQLPLREIELLKGEDETAPVVMAMTLESP